MLVQNAITSIIDDNEDDGEDDDDNDNDDDYQFFIKKKTRAFISYHTWLAKICGKWLFMPLFLTMLWLSGSPKWKQLIISNNYSWIYAIDTNSKKNVAISENNNIIEIILKAFVPKCPLDILIGLPVRAMPNQKMGYIYIGQISQKALHVPFLLQKGLQFLRGVDGSFQVI